MENTIPNATKTHLLFSWNIVLVSTQFSTHSHSEIIVNIPQAIFKHAINNGVMPNPRTQPVD